MFISIQENHVFNHLLVVIKIMSKQYYGLQTQTKKRIFQQCCKVVNFQSITLFLLLSKAYIYLSKSKQAKLNSSHSSQFAIALAQHVKILWSNKQGRTGRHVLRAAHIQTRTHPFAKLKSSLIRAFWLQWVLSSLTRLDFAAPVKSQVHFSV